MIEYKQFEAYMKPILDWDAKYEKEAEALKQLYPSSFVVPEGGRLVESYIEILSTFIEDDNDWIDYFVWECDLGKTKPYKYVSIHGKKFKLKNIKDLYNLLVYSEKVK